MTAEALIRSIRGMCADLDGRSLSAGARLQMFERRVPAAVELALRWERGKFSEAEIADVHKEVSSQRTRYVNALSEARIEREMLNAWRR